MKHILSCVIALLLLAGCEPSKPRPLRAIVHKKAYHPAWTSYSPTFDSKGHITGTVAHHHPPEWHVVVQDEENQTPDGRWLFPITEKEYDELDLGDYWEGRHAMKAETQGE